MNALELAVAAGVQMTRSYPLAQVLSLWQAGDALE
jgi:hypothetical protein